MTALPDELEQWVLDALVKARYRDRLLTLRTRSRHKFVQLLFRTHRRSPSQVESAEVWRSELFERVPVPFQAGGYLVERLRTIQPTPWYVIAQTGLDQGRVDPGEIIENAHQAGLIAVTDDLNGAYLELEGKNTSWVAGTAKRVLGRSG
jgi:hypothetical protein